MVDLIRSVSGSKEWLSIVGSEVVVEGGCFIELTVFTLEVSGCFSIWKLLDTVGAVVNGWIRDDWWLLLLENKKLIGSVVQWLTGLRINGVVV